ncbi:serine hydrolase [Ascidiimonas sp. W6]|uniref:serine hydrolase n=1 Tax=Ascidiimonas meishanensis TaxID=3128903 RepID=UPI0030EC92D2
MFKKSFLLLLSFFGSSVCAQHMEVNPLLSEDAIDQKSWVQQRYDSLSIDEKIGQLLALKVNLSLINKDREVLITTLEKYPVGTLIVKQPEDWSTFNLVNTFHTDLRIPLLIGAETHFSFPKPSVLASIDNKDLLKKTGKQIGLKARRLGIHLNFLPGIPVYSSNSGSIASSSYSKELERATTFMRGLQSTGILSCGNYYFDKKPKIATSLDSLMTGFFSVMPHELSLLNYYTTLIDKGISAITTSYEDIAFPSYINEIPTELSENRLPEILKNKIGFKGLLISDIASSEHQVLETFLAGNDILRFSIEVPIVFNKLKEAYKLGAISEERLAYSVKKILMAKYKAGLHLITNNKKEELTPEMDTIEDLVLMENLAEASITLIKNEHELLPVRNLDLKKIAYVPMGDGDYSTFLNTMKLYGKVDLVQAPLLDELLAKLKSYNLVIIGLHPSKIRAKKVNQFSAIEKTWLYEISRQYNVILNLFTNPLELAKLSSVTNTETILVSYQNESVYQEKSAEIIFGAIPTKGVLPVSIAEEFKAGISIQTNALSRLSYGLPEQVGIQSQKLKKIDSVVHQAIDSMIIPGAQILIARKGKVIYHKSFGKTRYQNGEMVTNNHIYDLASLTKILSTLPMIMKLEETGKLSLQSALKQFYPASKGTNKENVTLLEMLTHYGRLKPWIPFYLYTLNNATKRPSSLFYSKYPKKDFTTKVVGNLYIRNDYKDSIKQRILETDLRKRKEYRYSDLPYYILKEVVEREFGSSLDVITQQKLYGSLGAYNTTYNPLDKFPRARLVPSENDTYFRHQVIQGYVHDMGAAMQGGVGGHAGLFSNANDIAKIMQMYLWEGYYGGKRYFKTRTIGRFNKCYFCQRNNRRGVGFDKPQLVENGPTCGCVSMKSFGHSGFTGTYTWADPEKEIVYVFLSNRTFPTASNRKLITEGTRTVIQQLIYDAIID